VTSLLPPLSLIPHTMSSATSDLTEPDAHHKKRAQVGTAMAKGTLDLPPCLESDLDEAMAMEFTTACNKLVTVIGDADQINPYMPWGWKFINALVDNVAWFVDEDRPMANMVVGRFLYATLNDETDTVNLVQRSFGGGCFPIANDYSEGTLPARVWVRLGDAGSMDGQDTLCNRVGENQWRAVADRSFAIYSPIVAAWPPPLWLAPDIEASTVWTFEVAEESDEATVIGLIKAAFEQSFIGMLSRQVYYILLDFYYHANMCVVCGGWHCRWSVLVPTVEEGRWL